MKAILDLEDSLLAQVQSLGAREGTSVQALVAEGLRRLLEERRARQPFRLRRASFGGNGLQPGQADTAGSELRDLIYEGRGS